MDFSARVGRYCERLGPEFWAEPLNAISNAAFLIAAAAGFFLWRAHGGRDPWALLLIVMAIVVAIGSFLFHTFATPWSWIADALPITAFIAGYTLLALYRFLGLGLTGSLLWLAAFEVVTVAVLLNTPTEFLNRAAGYLPALGALVLIGAALLMRGNVTPHTRMAARALLTAAALFAVSLFFRAVDLVVCLALPVGTHFLWHIFNALVIYVLLRAAILHGPRKA